MPLRGAGIGGVELAVHDAVERHGAGARAENRADDEQKCAPTWPTALLARGHNHRREREGQGENGVRDFDEIRPPQQLPEWVH